MVNNFNHLKSLWKDWINIFPGSRTVCYIRQGLFVSHFSSLLLTYGFIYHDLTLSYCACPFFPSQTSETAHDGKWARRNTWCNNHLLGRWHYMLEWESDTRRPLVFHRINRVERDLQDQLYVAAICSLTLNRSRATHFCKSSDSLSFCASSHSQTAVSSYRKAKRELVE